MEPEEKTTIEEEEENVKWVPPVGAFVSFGAPVAATTTTTVATITNSQSG